MNGIIFILAIIILYCSYESIKEFRKKDINAELILLILIMWLTSVVGLIMIAMRIK